MSLSSGAARLWLRRLEQLYILKPSFVSHLSSLEERKNKNYPIIKLLICLFYLFNIIRFGSGAFTYYVSQCMGNYFTTFGPIGKLISPGTAAVLCVSFLLRAVATLWIDCKTTFLNDLLAYDDLSLISQGKHPQILKGFYRVRMISTLKKLKYLNNITFVLMGISLITVVIVGTVSMIVEGITLKNILLWCGLWNLITFILAYFASSDFVIILGFWYVGKRHLDLQLDIMIESIDLISRGCLPVQTISKLNIYYTKVVGRIDEFNQFSKILITPYRLLLTSCCGVLYYGFQVVDNVYASLGLRTCIVGYFVISLAFLSTTSSLSVRRRLLYHQVNNLFSKLCHSGHLRECLILRRLIKSLGNRYRPKVSLTDTTGREFNSMEFVDYILDCFSIYFLIVKLYRRHF